MTRRFYAVISIEVFKTPFGKPTCASNFETGDICKFRASKNYGSQDLCTFPMTNFISEPLYRSEEGFLVPHQSCPLQHL